MFWLLACAPPPSLTLPVVPPSAVNATAEPAERFVGPLDLGDLDAAALCEAPDHAALLKAGRFGWRVLVLGPDGFRLADEVGEPGSAAERDARTKARVQQWGVADEVAAERCGAPVITPVLVAVDGGTGFDSDTFLAPSLWDLSEVRLLVTDPDPGPAVAPRAPRATPDARSYLTLVAAPEGWVILGNQPEIPPSEHTTAEDAVRRVIEAGYPEVVYTVAPLLPWSRAMEGIDAFAGAGVVPSFGLVVSDQPKPRPTPIAARAAGTRLTLGDTVAVLEYAFPSYVSRPRGDGRPGSRTILFHMIGTSGSPPGDFGEPKDSNALFGLPPHAEPPPPAGALPAP